ncbi:small membrane protein [Klebsiella pneumoniae]|nr:small membrane protein [Klebsiella pneumoniae]
MANIIFLIVAVILLIICIYFLFSYIRDQRKNKLTFNKRKW